MDTVRQEVEHLLKAYGGKLIRRKKHHVWKLPSGRKWVTPSTPSDSQAWQNNLGELKLMLGLKASDKKQSDFDHQKKASYVKRVETPIGWLTAVPVRVGVVLPAPPKGPDKDERATMAFEERFEKEVGPPVREILGRVPGKSRKKGERSGKPYTYSPEVLAHANFLLKVEGQKASSDYLSRIKAEAVKSKEEVKEKMETPGRPVEDTSVMEGGVERQIKLVRDKIRTWRKTIDVDYKKLVADAEAEVWRLTQELSYLEKAHSLATASKAELASMMPSNGSKQQGDLTETGRRRKGFWDQVVIEVAGTNPMSLTQGNLAKELRKMYPEATPGTLYQAIRRSLKSGAVFLDVAGFVRVREEGKA